jgi:hypothetical protein
MKRFERIGPRTQVLSVVVAALLAQATPARAAGPGGGQLEGIKVHGHWTIVVKNADGSLASTHEFENALVTATGIGGGSLLSGLLANYYSDPIWIVSLSGPNTTGPCQHDGSSQMWPCRVAEPRAPFSGSEYSKNLVVGLPLGSGQQQRPNGTLELSGSVTAVHDGEITLVDSAWYVAARNHFGSLTMKALPSPIQVRAGQIIQVRVVISFS